MTKELTKPEFKFFTTIRVRYAEVDLQGIVFNAHYLTYIDTAITEYFRAIGYTYLDFVKKYSMDTNSPVAGFLYALSLSKIRKFKEAYEIVSPMIVETFVRMIIMEFHFVVLQRMLFHFFIRKNLNF